MCMKEKAFIEDIKQFILKNKLWMIQFVCLIGFLALAEDVFHKEIMDGDVIGYEFLSRYFISDTFTPIAKFITNFGGVYILLGLTVLLVVCLKDKTEKILVPVNLVVITILNQFLKQVLQRPRPTEYRIINESGYSFPSGHSMVSMAFYGYLIYLIYSKVRQVYVKWGSIVMLGILILAIGTSRIYLGVHYTSDVLAGFLISVAYLILFVKGINVVLGKRRDYGKREFEE